MTITEARTHIETVCNLDFSYTRKSGVNEYRVNLRTEHGGTAESAFYTLDLTRAVAHAGMMAIAFLNSRILSMDKIIAFNTHRRYTDKGQRIAAKMTADGGLLFVDIDRGFDSFVDKADLDEDFKLTVKDVMHVYDYRTNVWNSMKPFRYPEDIARLKAAAQEV